MDWEKVGKARKRQEETGKNGKGENTEYIHTKKQETAWPYFVKINNKNLKYNAKNPFEVKNVSFPPTQSQHVPLTESLAFSLFYKKNLPSILEHLPP